MTIYTVTTSNWNNASFWSAISESTGGHEFDLTGLPSTFTVTSDPVTGFMTISDGVTTFTIGDSTFGGSSDVSLGGGTTFSLFNIFRSGDGDSTLTGTDGNDALYGGDGNDVIADQLGNDTVYGGAGNDTLGSGRSAGLDVFYGGTGDDDIYIGNGEDTAYGGDDSDIIRSQGSGLDKFAFGGEGGTDNDTLSWATEIRSIYAVSVNFSSDEAGTGVIGGKTVTFSEFENIELTQVNDTVDATATTGGVNVRGLDGNDSMLGGAGGDDLDGGMGNDSIVGAGGGDTIRGGTGGDSIDGGNDADRFIIEDGFGNDTIIGGEGGADNDVIDLSALTSSITVTYTGDEAGTITDGTDTISFSEIEQIILTDQNDSVDGTADSVGINIVDSGGDDTITGGSGNDTIIDSDSNTSHDLINGGGGNDSIVAGGFDTVYADDGDDTVTMGYSNGGNEAHGGAGNDLLSGTNGNQALYGGAGNDTINGGNDYGTSDPDTLDGGDGNDSIISGMTATPNDAGWQARGDLMSGGAGDDTIVGGTAEDTISGGTGNDSMSGGQGTDTFLISDGFGADTIAGGEGAAFGDDRDVIDLSNMTGPVTVNYTTDEAGTITDGTDTISFSEVEDLILTDFDDSVVSGSAVGGHSVDLRGGNDIFDVTDVNNISNDTVLGGDGDDTINAGSGRDSILGGDGDDVIDGGDREDTIYGGAGNDRIEAGEEFSFAESDLIYGGTGNDTITSVETGIDSNDTIYGDEGDDVIDVTGGDANLLDGGADNDSITSGTGNDTLIGGSGDDTLTGGTGDDSISGGAGNDTYVFTPGDGNDTITDFNTGNTGTLDDGDSSNNDFIDLSGFYDHISELYADQADDGVLNQSNTTDGRGFATDYSDNSQFNDGSIEMQGASADSSSFTQENTGVVCFTSGTAIRTPFGEVIIDDLRVGDLVTTMDNGPQRIAWIGKRHVTHSELRQNKRLHPVLIKQGVLGAERDLLVSRQHGMLLGQDHLARATHLAKTLTGVRIATGKRQVTYVHLLFEAHQIIFAEGTPSESFYPGPMGLEMLSSASRKDIGKIFPHLPSGAQSEDIATAFGTTARSFLENRKAVETWLSDTKTPVETAIKNCDATRAVHRNEAEFSQASSLHLDRHEQYQAY